MEHPEILYPLGTPWNSSIVPTILFFPSVVQHNEVGRVRGRQVIMFVLKIKSIFLLGSASDQIKGEICRNIEVFLNVYKMVSL